VWSGAKIERRKIMTIKRFEFELDIVCGSCGNGLKSVVLNEDDEIVKVYPCEKCLAVSSDEGYDEGYNRGYDEGGAEVEAEVAKKGGEK
jgi:hypothetical protein